MTVVKDHARVLLVEDEPDIREVVRVLLEIAGMSVVEAADGRTALRKLLETAPDIVILDIGIPNLDGWQVLERVRDMSDIPVLVLTARGSPSEKVRGLTSGADDFVTKPFNSDELVARVETLLRRSTAPAPIAIYEDDWCQIDFASRIVRQGEPVIALTPIEFGLLSAFVHEPRKVLSTVHLLDLVWGDPTATAPDRVKYGIARLRAKLGWQSPERSPLTTLRGVGYRYDPSGGTAS